MTFREYAYQHLSVGLGLQAIAAQEANKAFRHCRVGNVTPRPLPSSPTEVNRVWRRIMELVAAR